MTQSVRDFYDTIPAGLKQIETIEMFVYFLTEIKGNEVATGKCVRDCFEECNLHVPKSPNARLSEGLKKKTKKNRPKYVKKKNGYALHNDNKKRIEAILSDHPNNHPIAVKAHGTIQETLDKLGEGKQKVFCQEAINCFYIKAYRAAIVMAWCSAISHLRDYIFYNKLAEFNEAKKEKFGNRYPTDISYLEDFEKISDYNFNEICKKMNVIPTSIAKRLNSMRELRALAAHPSATEIGQADAASLIEFVINNILIKFKVN